MSLIKIKCTFCNKKFFRPRERVNEAKKFGWKQYCSRKCQDQARIRKVEKICANPDCHKKVFRELSQFKKSKSGRIFCSRSCAISVHNSESPKRKKEVIIKICQYCGKKFVGEGEKFCSTNCQYKAQTITKEELLKQIKTFYKRNKRIPLKREFHHYDAVRARFGTWNKSIEAAGFEPNPVLFAKKCIANDGHKCDSFAEKIIDDWLYVRKIKHKRQVPYPENSSLTVDFVTENNWIEFFGLAGDLKEYDRLIKKKQMLAKKYRLHLLEIYPKDLFPVNSLAKILKF